MSAAEQAEVLARRYETIYILRPNVTTDEAEKVSGRVVEVVDRLNGKIVKVDNWGRRKLAYEIRRHTRGIFVYVQYVGYNDLVAELERNLRLLETVMRFQTIVIEEDLVLGTVEVDAEETAFVHVEGDDDEPELDRAQRLGLAPLPSESDGDGDDDEPAEGEAAADAATAEAGEEKAEEAEAAPAEGDAPAADAAEEAPAAEEKE